MNDEAKNTRPEPSSVDWRGVLAFAGGILLFLFASMGVLFLIYGDVIPRVASRPPANFPVPRLQADESAALSDFLIRQRAELDSFRWENADHTLVGIPIERAMQIIAARGNDAYAPIESGAPAGGKKP